MTGFKLSEEELNLYSADKNELDDFLGKLGKAGNEIGNSLKTGLSGLGNLGR